MATQKKKFGTGITVKVLGKLGAVKRCTHENQLQVAAPRQNIAQQNQSHIAVCAALVHLPNTLKIK
jgi:hypothetical protein